ncbi:VOC family protein [Halosegnis marinus]|uniref:VOC family protein n=1 Tax=Halosegnis marinus TaxID=3034023 RepID=A0ABD5ZMJ9_9EURY|nr:VOC family protein [Halosegnis sp. DT85]
MDLRIDHVTVAGRSLDALRDAFAAAGLDTTEGGAHSNGVTHMATLTLPDGSYLELVSTVEEGAASPWWDAAIRTDAGPCAWAVRVDDAAATAAAMRERGVAVEGPVEYARERPDGVVVEWELVYLGDGEPGSLLPFCIADTTPRAERAGEPSPGVGPTAVRTVVVAVPDLAAATDRLRAAFDLAAPVEGESEHLDARVARFPDAPVALATPRDGGPLAERLDAVGSSPCAFLLDAKPGVEERYPTAATESWGDATVAWLDGDHAGVRGLGLVGA